MPHWQPKDSKSNIAEEIVRRVRVASKDPMVELPSLMRMSTRDLNVLMLATQATNDPLTTFIRDGAHQR